MNIDTLLRETMRAHADDAPPGAGLGSAARQRAHRRRTHRVLAGGGTALAGVVAVAVAVPLLVQPMDGPRPGALDPTELAPFEPDLPAIPYTPGWTPAGLAEPYVELQPIENVDGTDAGHTVRALHYPEGTGWPPAGAPSLVMSTTPYDPVAAEHNPTDGWRRRPGGTYAGTEQVTMRGGPATLAERLAGGWVVAWQERPDLWVHVYAAADVGRIALLRYVAELVPEPLPVRPPVSLAVAPAGAELTHVSPGLLRLESVGRPDEPGAVPAIVSVLLGLYHPADVDDALPTGYTSTTVSVNGQPAELVEPRGTIHPARLVLPVAPDLVLVTDSWGNAHLSGPELLRLAEGITLTAPARPGWGPGS